MKHGTAILTLCICAWFTPAAGPQAKAPNPPALKFTDVTRQLGITWEHVNGATEEKYLIETMGGGGAFLDYNRDGRLDIFLVNSGCHRFSMPAGQTASPQCQQARNALYRQNPDGNFTDMTELAGLATTGYGMGVAVGDYDNDGHPDLYVTNFGPNILYRNNGDGTFTDVTRKAGVSASGWSTSAVFFDYNQDGLPDLFVGRYLDWDYSKNTFCGERRPGYRAYCHPDQFRGISNLLYRNNGDGTFSDVSQVAGISAQEGKALGVVAFDFNRDGWLDLYVANDAVRNFLFRNNGDGTFSEIALVAEVAYGLHGKPESGMGTDAADFDGDAWPDLFVTNIDSEPNNLLRNNGDETFSDVTIPAGLGAVAILFSGFGTRFVDFDSDGDLDIVVLNGHVLDNAHLFREGVTFAERPFLLENAGGRFREVGANYGAVFEKTYVGRALAIGDYDNDGDVDFLWVANGGPPALVRNDVSGPSRPRVGNAWIGFELIGRASGRDAIGSLVTVVAAGRRQVRELVGGASYCAAHDLRLLFGLAEAEKVDKVEVRWPSGARSELQNLAARRYYRVEEPSTGATPKNKLKTKPNGGEAQP